MSAPPGFAERVTKYSDAQLAEVLASAPDYTPEAVKIVMAEWDRRKLTTETVASTLAQRQAREELRDIPGPAAPQTWKGIGFISYGREFIPGAGYITTQWFCLFLLPIIPTRSFRFDNDAIDPYGDGTPIPLHLRQVLRTYAFVIASAAFVSAGLLFASKLSENEHDYAALAIAAIAVLVPIFFVQMLRRNARRK